MNKIFKSGGKWQVLKKRVSPAVIAFQAFSVTVLVMIAVLLLKYNPETVPAAKRDFHRTISLSSGSLNFNRLLDELDPSCSANHSPVIPEFAVQQMVKFKLYRPQLVTEPVKLPGFRNFSVVPVGVYPDFRTTPEAADEPRLSLEMAVLYDQYGKEIARWKPAADPIGEKTVFRVDGQGALKHTMLTTSCGNNAVDRQALTQAASMQLKSGIYSVWYPTAKRNM